MCGFAGFLAPDGLAGGDAREIAERMGLALLHRGPDDSGVWVDEAAGIALSHRRLSILDLSPAGHQPMQSECGRYVIAFNGEIYNHLELRGRLSTLSRPSAWRGHSDTETLLEAIAAYGVESALSHCVGMFAFALWDRRERTLVLARDRMGEKPLYYGWQGRGAKAAFLFGSELKSLRMHPSFEGDICRDALCLQLRHNYIPAPYSIYRGIQKLLPGHLVEISARELEAASRPQPRAYWRLADAVASGRENPFTGSEEEAVDALDVLLRDAVAKQMLSDVSLGAFLSGGLDSSTVVSLMQAQSTRPVKTFTIGFHEEVYDEAKHARRVAAHLGTEHTEFYVTPQHAMDVIPRLPTLFDEPFSDSSQIPTFLVSSLARKNVTVALSGDAGDELFCGYSRYNKARDWERRVSRLPRPLRLFLAHGLNAVPWGVWNELGNLANSATGERKAPRSLGHNARKFAELLSSRNHSELYRNFVTHWPDPARVVLGGKELPTAITRPTISLPDILEQMMYLDSVSYLPDDILVKVDRSAMGVSLESRVPFLDHRVVEFAWRLPLGLKMRNDTGKWILRQVAGRYIPKELLDRPKMGFGLPFGDWLRTPLRGWAEELLDEARLRREGFLDPMAARRIWEEHRAGKRNWQYLLWDVLMFQAWLAHQSRPGSVS